MRKIPLRDALDPEELVAVHHAVTAARLVKAFGQGLDDIPSGPLRSAGAKLAKAADPHPHRDRKPRGGSGGAGA